MNESEGLRPGTVIGGRYRVEGALGRGGMGAVYLVRHVRTEERLALKLIHASIAGNPDLVERFRREARAPAQIDSDHVVRVLDADVAPEIGGAPFLVMEFLRGQDLEHVVKDRGPLPPADVVNYLGQAARALDKAHRMGIVHRDLKPENLFLAERDDGTVCLKVLDFGIAKLAGDAGAQTATGSMLGTPLYMAPEQAQGTRGLVGPETDVWALGLIAFKLLTAQIYWRFESGPDLILKIVAMPMVPPSALVPWLGPSFDAWFLRCCARPVEQRFRSTGEAALALGSALGIQVPVSGSMGPAPMAPMPARTQPAQATKGNILIALIVAGVVAAVVLVGGVVLFVAMLSAGEPKADRTARPAPTPSSAPAPTPVPTAAPAPAPSSADTCKAACSKLADCVQVTDPSCEANCENNPAFASCLRSRDSCASFSSCVFASVCGGHGPSGNRSCKATAECEGRCVTRGGDDTGCICSCVRTMAPEHANDLMMNNLCGTVHCSACRAPVDGVACLACFARECGADALPCKRH
jgi:predicted Ser/Thr protein kinase